MGIKAKIGLIENPPDPRVMENAACIAPWRSGPLKDILSPLCFTSSASSESGQFRRCLKLLVKVVALHQDGVDFSPYLYDLGGYRDLHTLEERHVQR